MIQHTRIGAATSTLTTHASHGSRAAETRTAASLEHLLGMIPHALPRDTAGPRPAATELSSHSLHLLPMHILPVVVAAGGAGEVVAGRVVGGACAGGALGAATPLTTATSILK